MGKYECWFYEVGEIFNCKQRNYSFAIEYLIIADKQFITWCLGSCVDHWKCGRCVKKCE
jgi:hypothetical protein